MQAYLLGAKCKNQCRLCSQGNKYLGLDNTNISGNEKALKTLDRIVFPEYEHMVVSGGDPLMDLDALEIISKDAWVRKMNFISVNPLSFYALQTGKYISALKENDFKASLYDFMTGQYSEKMEKALNLMKHFFVSFSLGELQAPNPTASDYAIEALNLIVKRHFKKKLDKHKMMFRSVDIPGRDNPTEKKIRSLFGDVDVLSFKPMLLGAMAKYVEKGKLYLPSTTLKDHKGPLTCIEFKPTIYFRKDKAGTRMMYRICRNPGGTSYSDITSLTHMEDIYDLPDKEFNDIHRAESDRAIGLNPHFDHKWNPNGLENNLGKLVKAAEGIIKDKIGADVDILAETQVYKHEHPLSINCCVHYSMAKHLKDAHITPQQWLMYLQDNKPK